jgi:hypothetical protein
MGPSPPLYWKFNFIPHLYGFAWLRHYATGRKVAGSIPDEVIGFFNWPNPSSRTVALGSAQSLTEMSAKADNLTAICEPIV